MRHFTASAVVFDDAGRVLLVHHNKLGRWLYPGGHVEPDEDPAQAAIREVREETGVGVQLISGPLFAHPAVTVHVLPYAILEMPVSDSRIGPRRHIDMVYVAHATSTALTAQIAEVGSVRWLPLADIGRLDTPAELPALLAAAARYGQARRCPADPPGSEATRS
jgi:8-oxo-dGTP diphosphatase